MPQRAIIVGGGSIGSRVAAILADYGHDPIVVEQDLDRCQQLDVSLRAQIIHGDATQSEIVEQADPERADIFAALTGHPRTNHTLCQLVGSRPGATRTVARGDSPDNVTATNDAADRTVRPTVVGSKRVVNAMLAETQHLRSLPSRGFDLVETTVAPRAPVANETVNSVSLPAGCDIVANTETMRIADSGSELRPGHQYLLAVEPEAADTVQNLFRGAR